MDNQSTYQSIVTKCLIQDVKTGTAISNDLMQKKEKKKNFVESAFNNATTLAPQYSRCWKICHN